MKRVLELKEFRKSIKTDDTLLLDILENTEVSS